MALKIAPSKTSLVSSHIPSWGQHTFLPVQDMHRASEGCTGLLLLPPSCNIGDKSGTAMPSYLTDEPVQRGQLGGLAEQKAVMKIFSLSWLTSCSRQIWIASSPVDSMKYKLVEIKSTHHLSISLFMKSPITMVSECLQWPGESSLEPKASSTSSQQSKLLPEGFFSCSCLEFLSITADHHED